MSFQEKAVEAIKSLNKAGFKAFLTAESGGDGGPRVVAKFRHVEEMFAFYKALVECGKVVRDAVADQLAPECDPQAATEVEHVAPVEGTRLRWLPEGARILSDNESIEKDDKYWNGIEVFDAEQSVGMTVAKAKRHWNCDWKWYRQDESAPEVEYITPTAEHVGQMVEVRDCDAHEWQERILLAVLPSRFDLQFLCEFGSGLASFLPWRYARVAVKR